MSVASTVGWQLLHHHWPPLLDPDISSVCSRNVWGQDSSPSGESAASSLSPVSPSNSEQGEAEPATQWGGSVDSCFTLFTSRADQTWWSSCGSLVFSPGWIRGEKIVMVPCISSCFTNSYQTLAHSDLFYCQPYYYKTWALFIWGYTGSHTGAKGSTF